MRKGKGKQTATQRREWLKNSIREHLLPVLAKQGFRALPSLPLVPPVDQEYVLSFPSWGRLVRTRESGVDLIEIQLATFYARLFGSTQVLCQPTD